MAQSEYPLRLHSNTKKNTGEETQGRKHREHSKKRKKPSAESH